MLISAFTNALLESQKLCLLINALWTNNGQLFVLTNINRDE